MSFLIICLIWITIYVLICEIWEDIEDDIYGYHVANKEDTLIAIVLTSAITFAIVWK